MKYFFLILLSFTVYAQQGNRVIPTENLDLGGVNFGGQAAGGGGPFNITALVSCFGTNLRSVPDPLNPNSTVTMKVSLARLDGVTGSVSVKFPASAVKGGGTTSYTALVPGSTLIMDPTTLDPSVKGGIQGQTILVSFSYTPPPGQRPFNLSKVEFTQNVNGPDPNYAAYDGPVARSLSYNYSGDNSTLYIEASFPGAEGFCGGYYSPLMMFFSDERPKLLNSTTFKLRPGPYSFFWPEGSADWAFLAIDKNGNGKIDSGEELFGDWDKANGFEVLKALDSDKDGKITAKDKDFTRLRLWFDLDGDGATGKGELKSLSSREVKEISLAYDGTNKVALATRGELRESGKVILNKGEARLIDVWLSVHQEYKPNKLKAQEGR